ncbi:hypothetical protein L3Q82_005618 [Scortum barcoo]|uniref:Uncharacterized protein n=1 Tax=Scortum barcoo TaxID=214431 RepID=A0ACB8V6G9_9TELE|nr:hypothetical protein L3Q82_005618 [Scortum barcoo]
MFQGANIMKILSSKQRGSLVCMTRHQREYRECSLLLFTETWLTALTPDTAAELDGFTLLRADRSKGERQPAVTCTVKRWSEEAEEALKDCFNTTLWDVFSDTHGEDIDSLTHCLTDYINFCVENTVPTRTVLELLQQQALDYPGH